MNNPNNINQVLQGLFQMKSQGGNPQQIMQMIMRQNPNYRQNISVLQNMAQGRSPQEFLTQLAKQRGVSEQNIQTIMQMLNK